jgi:hypothetical protein
VFTVVSLTMLLSLATLVAQSSVVIRTRVAFGAIDHTDTSDINGTIPSLCQGRVAMGIEE